MKKNKIRYYSDYNEDYITTSNQDYTLPQDYKWIRSGPKAFLLSKLTYLAAYIAGGFYCRAVLHLRIKNKRILKQEKKGIFVYGNHTQPFGDVIIPALACHPKRIYTVCSPSNLGIKGMGKALPYLGALPTPDSINGIKKLNYAITQRIEQNSALVIYPEAHVWEYYTKIRPFDHTSFAFPVKTNSPSYSMTSVYTKSKIFKRPILTLYMDGPFFADPTLSRREQAKQLRDKIYETMCKRSTQSNIDYIKYVYTPKTKKDSATES